MMSKNERISWAFYLILIGVILSIIIYYEYFYKISWVNTNTFFQYSLQDDGVYLRIENEKDLGRLFDIQSFGPFRPYKEWKEILSKYGQPIKYMKEKGVEYASYFNKEVKIIYYGEHHEDRNYICLKAILVDKTIDNFIINDDIKRLIRDRGNIKRIWVCKNDQTRFFCIVNYPLIEEIHWNHTKNWGEPY